MDEDKAPDEPVGLQLLRILYNNCLTSLRFHEAEAARLRRRVERAQQAFFNLYRSFPPLKGTEEHA